MLATQYNKSGLSAEELADAKRLTVTQDWNTRMQCETSYSINVTKDVESLFDDTIPELEKRMANIKRTIV